MAMSDPGERARALLRAARADGLAPSDKARLRAALAGKLAVGAPQEPSGEAPTSPPPPLAGSGAGGGVLAGKAAGGVLSGKVIAAGALIGAVAFAGGFFTGRATVDAPPPASAAPPASAPAVAPPAATPPAAAPETAPAPKAAPPRPRAPRAVAPAPPRPLDLGAEDAARAPSTGGGEREPARSRGGQPARPSTLAAEMALLREAQDAVRDGDPSAALERLDDLGARFPEGQLREERMAARVLALCAAGRAREARAEAERLLGEATGSVHAGRVRASCAFRENLD
ncbi:hypothetical protein [Sorangium atrum]|uniref:Tetratricopeptide repeat protein n=1 Tax=Sorangium atrum TaxID=2995308 RepID=A0ABT5CCL2_9BACT|nr:hypothetical protein [Sorangium aterium]MDC0684181.1 hypothetical protein [Sorangium aterium]